MNFVRIFRRLSFLGLNSYAAQTMVRDATGRNWPEAQSSVLAICYRTSLLKRFEFAL
jgi:hypothetical protein